MTLKFREYPLGGGKISYSASMERATWNGTVRKHFDADSSRSLNPSQISDITRNGVSGMGALQLSYERAAPCMYYGIDLNGGGFFAGKRLFLDPGMWLRYPWDRGAMHISVGIISSQPDMVRRI